MNLRGGIKTIRGRSWRFAPLLILAAFGLYLIGNNSVGLWDRDEPRNAEASRQMLQSGDWVVPHFLDQVRTAKPVFIYWCQASAMAIFGDGRFAARFPSALSMTATLAVLIVALSRRIGRRRAVWTGFIFATSGLTIAAAKMAVTDSVLLLWIVIAQLCLFRIWRGQRDWATWIVIGIAIGTGGLTKGPVPLGVMGMTLVMLWIFKRLNPLPASPRVRREGWVLGPLLAFAITAAIVAPWLILIHHRQPDFLPTIIHHDVLQRMQTGLEGHSAPPGYYFLLIWVLFFPWSILLPAAIVYGFKHRDDPRTRFALASVVGPWLMFELIKTKLPHYILPIFPGLAYLTARMLIARCVHRRWDAGTRLTVRLGFAAFPVIAIAYGLILPRIDALRISPRVGAILREHKAAAVGDVIMIDYKEPSLAFEQGGTIREESDNAFLARHAPGEWPSWIVMTDTIWKSLSPDIQSQLDRIGTVRGWWYSSKLRTVEVIVVRKRSAG